MDLIKLTPKIGFRISGQSLNRLCTFVQQAKNEENKNNAEKKLSQEWL